MSKTRRTLTPTARCPSASSALLGFMSDSMRRCYSQIGDVGRRRPTSLANTEYPPFFLVLAENLSQGKNGAIPESGDALSTNDFIKPPQPVLAMFVEGGCIAIPDCPLRHARSRRRGLR